MNEQASEPEMSPTSHPAVFRRLARAKRAKADRGFVRLVYQPFPEDGAIRDLFTEAQRLRRTTGR